MLARSEFGMSYLQAPSSHEGENILYQRHSLRPVRLKSFTRWEARKPLQAISVFSIHVALYLIPWLNGRNMALRDRNGCCEYHITSITSCEHMTT
jgi:hypothetical protein